MDDGDASPQKLDDHGLVGGAGLAAGGEMVGASPVGGTPPAGGGAKPVGGTPPAGGAGGGGVVTKLLSLIIL